MWKSETHSDLFTLISTQKFLQISLTTSGLISFGQCDANVGVNTGTELR